MSSTATSTKTISRTGSIILSPSKRRRLSGETQGPSTKEIWEWTLTSASVAKCYIRDAMTMRESESRQEHDFYWLGSAPCRKVEICGIIVGIQVFEKKVLYTIDDGTAVIDCRHAPHQPPRPQTNSKSTQPQEFLPPLNPIGQIGDVIKVVGKVQQKYETRILLADDISTSCLGDQLEHWKTVRERHRTCYSCPGPFTIPVSNPAKGSPQKVQLEVPTPPTPSTTVSTPGTTTLSPIKPESLPKLRHPSRLRSYNLTDTTFRLYVKHFIDNAPGDTIPPSDDTNEELEAYPLQRRLPPASDHHNFRTPTKSRRHAPDNHPSHPDAQATPRPGRSNSAANTTFQSFTLSYLRRVPELSLMAKRVVKQRARAEDKKARELASQSSPKKVVKRKKLDKAGLAAKQKRLFQWTIRELLREGSIVLWDGPQRPCPEDKTYGNQNASILWKYSSSTPSDKSLFSNANDTTRTIDSDDELELSDPEPNEEGYISTKPELFSSSVEVALKELTVAPPKRIVKRNELVGGFTKEEVLECLRKDDRWAFIGEWNISEALEYMEQDGSVWHFGSGRWLLTQ